MTITWNTGVAAMRARHNLKLKKNKKIKKRVSAQARKRSSSREGGPASLQARKDLTLNLGYYKI